jgi:hypothetical protein
MEMLENKSTDDNKPQDACNVINTLKINLIWQQFVNTMIILNY